MFKIVYFTKKIQKNHSKYSEHIFITLENYGAAHSKLNLKSIIVIRKRLHLLVFEYCQYLDK